MSSDSGLVAGTTAPAAMFQQTTDGWEQIGEDLTGDAGSVLDVTEYDGGTHVAVTTSQREQTGVGQVFARDADGWTKIGDELNNEVMSLEVFQDELYAVTSGASGEIYQYVEDNSWDKIISKPDWNGFAASQIFDDKLFVGDALHDVFGYFDGEQFVFEADQGGSCIFSFEVHDDKLFSGAYSGLVYERSGDSWPVDIDVGYEDVFEMESHDGDLFLGLSDGKLIDYDVEAGTTEVVNEFSDSVVGLVSDGSDLIVGTGANAAQYGSYIVDGTADTFRVLLDGTVELLTDTEDFGGAVQVTTNQPVQRRNGAYTRSATALSYIPGLDEDASRGGNRNDSAIPDWVDGWFHGDEHADGLEESLTGDDGALAQDKDPPEYNESKFDDYQYGGDDDFPHVRVINDIEVTVESSDDETMDNYTATSTSNSSPITLEGESGEGNPIRDNVSHWYKNHPDIDEPWEYASPDGKAFEDTKEIEVNGVEGVRVSQIYGGGDIYLQIMESKLFNLGNAAFIDALFPQGAGEYNVGLLLSFLTDLPKMYTFLELTVMADGSSTAHIWDAGPYPRHALYVGETKSDATKRGHTDFERGDEWEANQISNPRFNNWSIDAQTPGHSPFAPGGETSYRWVSGDIDSKVTHIKEGNELTADELQDSDTLGDPFVPSF